MTPCWKQKHSLLEHRRKATKSEEMYRSSKVILYLHNYKISAHWLRHKSFLQSFLLFGHLWSVVPCYCQDCSSADGIGPVFLGCGAPLLWHLSTCPESKTKDIGTILLVIFSEHFGITHSLGIVQKIVCVVIKLHKIFVDGSLPLRTGVAYCLQVFHQLERHNRKVRTEHLYAHAHALYLRRQFAAAQVSLGNSNALLQEAT